MKAIVTGALQATEQDLARLRQLGLDITVHKDERSAVENPEQYEAAICNGLFLYNDIEKFTNLKYIQLTSAGFDRVPMDYIRSHGITIHNAAGVYSVPMAEYAVWGVLELYKQGRFFAENQKQRRWEKHRGLMELAGKTVCVIGCGSVGSECAKRFEAFGCKVLGIATAARKQAYFDSVQAMDCIGDVLPQADVVILALPLTQDTRGFFSADMLEKMKPGAVLVNIARGAIVDTAALTAALKTRLRGAVLDVFEEEPLSEASPLWDLDNVILTPHNSFVGEGNHQRLMQAVCSRLKSHA